MEYRWWWIASIVCRTWWCDKCKVIKDRETNRSKGFGFVEMDDDSGEGAISSLDGSEHDGRNIKVNKSKGKK